jgi:hypothetical protein
MLGVAWLNTDPRLASARFRAIIPRDILTERQLIQPGRDVIVAAKHGWNPEEVRKLGRKMVMDVCDDHFHDKYAKHYRTAVELADAVTCNSREMARVILAETGRQATVIDDPYEDPELEPSLGDGALWFGHSSNLRDLEAVSDQIRHPLTIITNHNWHPDALDKALRACKAVVIPTGKSMAKSANRAIKAIRYGKFPVCGYLPAHSEIGLGTKDLGGALDACMAGDYRGRVKVLQAGIRDRFCPDKVAKDWYKVLYETESL